MPIPANATLNARTTLEKLKAWIVEARDRVASRIAICDTGSVDVHAMLAWATNGLHPAKTAWNAIRTTPGIAAEVRLAWPSEFADDAAAQAAMDAIQAAADAAYTAITDGVPKDASGWLLTMKLNAATNTIEQRVITGAGPIATLRGHLQTLLNALTQS